MQVGEVLFIIALNCIIIAVLYLWQRNSIEKRIKHLKNEVQDLEDLVAAIIEEFEEIAEATDAKISEVQNRSSAVNLTESSVALLKTGAELPSDYPSEIISEEKQSEVSQVIEDTQSIQDSESITDEPSEPRTKTESQRPVSDPKHQRILDLWQEGIAIEEIAKELGTGRGEVQLILGIYRRG